MLTQDFAQGAIKLVDLETKENLLKIAWLKRLKNESQGLQRDLVLAFTGAMVESITQANITKKDIQEFFSIPNSIWGSVWVAWSRLSYHSPINKQEILQQRLLYNSHIKIDHKVLTNDTFKKLTIKTLDDMVDLDTGRFHMNDIVGP